MYMIYEQHSFSRRLVLSYWCRMPLNRCHCANNNHYFWNKCNAWLNRNTKKKNVFRIKKTKIRTTINYVYTYIFFFVKFPVKLLLLFLLFNRVEDGFNTDQPRGIMYSKLPSLRSTQTPTTIIVCKIIFYFAFTQLCFYMHNII